MPLLKDALVKLKRTCPPNRGHTRGVKNEEGRIVLKIGRISRFSRFSREDQTMTAVNEKEGRRKMNRISEEQHCNRDRTIPARNNEEH